MLGETHSEHALLLQSTLPHQAETRELGISFSSYVGTKSSSLVHKSIGKDIFILFGRN